MFVIFYLFSVTEMKDGMQNMYANVIFINTETNSGVMVPNLYSMYRNHHDQPKQVVSDVVLMILICRVSQTVNFNVGNTIKNLTTVIKSN